MEEDLPTDEVSSNLEDNIQEKEGIQPVYEDGTAVKTLRQAINLFTNALIFVTVFVCLVYACRPKLTFFTLHIILCTLGYQFFMCQAVLAISRYNSWTVHLKRNQKIHVHWVLQLIGVGLVAGGTALVILESPETIFKTPHGALGIVAAGTSILSLLNGIVAICFTRFSSFTKLSLCLRVFHYVVGTATLFLSAASLCFAFENTDFKAWLSLWFNNDIIPGHVLQLMTTLFTLSVAVDFLIPVRRVG